MRTSFQVYEILLFLFPHDVIEDGPCVFGIVVFRQNLADRAVIRAFRAIKAFFRRNHEVTAVLAGLKEVFER